MSFDIYHVSLATDAQSEYILRTQLLLKDAVRQALSVSGHPQAQNIYHRLMVGLNQAISEAHGEYILGRGPTARAVFHAVKAMNPQMSSKEIVEQFISPQLPKYTKRGEDGDGADRSTNRHWATMLRVGLGADEKNRWNHEVLDRWFEEGKVRHFGEFSQDRDAVNQPGAAILRVDLNNGEHAYCVRVVTREYNHNALTLHEEGNPIEAAVLVPIEGIWATHDDGGLIDDAEVEGYVTALLEAYGIADEPLPIQVREDAQTAEETEQVEAVSETEIAALATDVAQAQQAKEATQENVYDELQRRQELAQEAGVDLTPSPESPEDVARLQQEALERSNVEQDDTKES